jgi:sigma-E factor negative regulatory protein RseC
MPASSVTLAALLGYLLPPVCLLVGAIIASTCYEGDAAAVLGAGFGFVAGLLLARLISRFAFGRETVPSICSPDLQPGEHP